MAILGKITTLFSDCTKTEALFPVTKTRAVSDDNGVGLNALLDDKQKSILREVLLFILQHGLIICRLLL